MRRAPEAPLGVCCALLPLLLCVACDQPLLVIEVGPDGGSDASADAGTDAGPIELPPGQVGGSLCDQQSSCDACRLCSRAPRESCNAVALVCEANVECVAVLTCAARCGDDACRRDCVSLHESGWELARALLSCEVCDACPRDCEAHLQVCEGGPLLPF